MCLPVLFASIFIHAPIPISNSGLPAGVVNMVFGVGPRAGEPLVRHPDVHLISFTGSTTVGKRIMSIGGEHLKKLSLEVYITNI